MLADWKKVRRRQAAVLVNFMLIMYLTCVGRCLAIIYSCYLLFVYSSPIRIHYVIVNKYWNEICILVAVTTIGMAWDAWRLFVTSRCGNSNAFRVTTLAFRIALLVHIGVLLLLISDLCFINWRGNLYR